MISSIGNIIRKYYRIWNDFTINIFASGVMTAMLQLFVYPFLAKELNAPMYGILLTIMGIENTIISAFGNSLNNLRLIQNDKYEINQNGDFNILLIISCIIATIIEVVVFYFCFSQNSVIIFGLLINAVLGILRAYYSAAFRLVLDFKGNLFCNAFISLGYLIGLFFFKTGIPWPVIFIIGEVCGLLYLFKNCVLLSNDFVCSPMMKTTIKKYSNFIGSSAIGSALTYLDRLLVMPVLGAEAVSLYSVSSVFGKMLGIVMLPIAGVMLGYFSQRDFKINKKIFSIVIALSLGICLIFYLVATLFGHYLTELLYPTLSFQAKPYMMMANLAAITAVLGNMISPIIVRYAASFWQLIITGSYAIIYCAAALLMSSIWGLQGFCIAAIVANIYRILLMCFIGLSGVNEWSK